MHERWIRNQSQRCTTPRRCTCSLASHFPLLFFHNFKQKSHLLLTNMSAGSCTIPPLFEDPFSPATFQNTHSIRFWHQRAARYGNSNDIKFLIEGSESQAEEYLRGLLASSITMFSLAVVWCIFLVAFKCIGPYGVGWLSGRHIPIKPKPLEADYAKEEEFQVASVSWDKKYKKILRSRKIMKGFVIFSGLGIVASSIMLSVKGYVFTVGRRDKKHLLAHSRFPPLYSVDSLLQTLDGADKFIDTATQLMKEGVILIDNVISSQDQLVIETKDAWEAINGICPQIREPICTEINDVNSCNFEGILETSEDMMMFLNFVADTRSLVFDELDKSRNDLLESIEFANSIGDIR